MRRRLGVDTGKYATKAVMRKTKELNDTDKKLKFISRIDESDADFGILNNNNTFNIEYNGKKYRVGESATYDSFEESKAQEIPPIHKMCLYTAIGLLVDNDDTVAVGIGCPLSIFLNKEQRENYRNFMLGERDIYITINGKRKHYLIDKIEVLPESAGVVYLHLEEYKDKTVGVIDIGGLNSNCCVYQNIAPLVSTVFTTRLGGKVMNYQLLDLLNKRLALPVPLQEYQMNEIVKNGYVRNRRDPMKEEVSAKIISDFKYQHVKEIYDKCIEHSWALDTIDLAFTGGTSQLLMPEIKQIFGVGDECFYADADMLNAEGFVRAVK